jgi:hypothetical protein
MDRQTPEWIGSRGSLPIGITAVSIVGEVVRCFAAFSILIVNDGK